MGEVWCTLNAIFLLLRIRACLLKDVVNSTSKGISLLPLWIATPVVASEATCTAKVAAIPSVSRCVSEEDSRETGPDLFAPTRVDRTLDRKCRK